MKNGKIIIAGGTGFIGQELTKYFSPDNKVFILTRGLLGEQNNAYGYTADKSTNITFINWDAKTGGEWEKVLEGADILINLTGKTVNCRYNEANKKALFDSRTNAVIALGNAVKKCENPPKLWINAASATIYRNAYDRPQDEFTGDIENDFSVQVCKKWEQTFFEQQTPGTRKIALRMAITLAPGGVLVPYLNLCKFGLGGKQGSGKQMFSWVHSKDIYKVILFLWEHVESEGVYNVSSPNAVTNACFMKKLRNATCHLFGLPAQAWMLKLGAAVLGTEPELLLKSRWVVPTRLLQEGFEFTYTDIDNAFGDIVKELPRKTYHLF